MKNTNTIANNPRDHYWFTTKGFSGRRIARFRLPLQYSAIVEQQKDNSWSWFIILDSDRTNPVVEGIAMDEAAAKTDCKAAWNNFLAEAAWD